MSDTKFNPEDMPILNLNASGTTRYEASRFLDSPEAMAAYLAESMKAGDTEGLIHALAEVAKAKGVNKVAKDAGVNRESLYKVLKSGAKTRFETIRKLMTAIGVELTVQPIAALAEVSKAAPRLGKPAAAVAKPTAKPAAKPAVKKPAAAGAGANPVTKPAAAVAKPAVKPAAKPAVKKPATAGAKPVTKPAAAVPKPAAKPAAKSAAKKPAVAKPAAKPAVKKPAAPALKPAVPAAQTPAASATPHSVANTNQFQETGQDRLATHS